MAYTYAQITQKIKDYTENDGTEFSSNIDDFIRNAELRIVFDLDFDFLKVYSSTTGIAADRFLNKPDGYIAERWLTVTDNNRKYPLKAKDTSWLEEAFPVESNTGRPQYYAEWDENTLVLAPVPDQAYGYRLAYEAVPESIVTASTTWIGNNIPHMLLYACLVEAFGYMKGMEHPDVKFYDEKYMASLAATALKYQKFSRHEAARYGERDRGRG